MKREEEPQTKEEKIEGMVKKMEEFSPKLLDLMVTKERDWMVRDSGGGGGGGNGFGVQEEKKLELKLGPPGGEDWGSSSSSSSAEKKVEDPSVFSLGFFPKASKTTKRGFLDTANSKNEEFQQKQQQQAQGHERKACPPSSSHAAASVNAAGINNNSSLAQPREGRTTSVPVVGWPPIRSFRKNLASSSSKPPPSPPQPAVVSPNGGSETGKKPETCNKGLFVKINMDGIPIGRKVDLKAYDSYEKLSSVVEELFQGLLAAQKDPATGGAQVSAEQKQVFTGLLDGTGEYTLVYEDNEGDRMLVGDVPWEMFVSTAKRLRVLKSSELATLTLGGVSRKRAATEC